MREFKRRTLAVAGLGPSVILFHRKTETQPLPPELKEHPHFVVNTEDLIAFGFSLLQADRLVPGSNQLLALYFAQHFSYDYYWSIEYDVRYTGSWKSFFSKYFDSEEDFLTSCIERYTEQNKGWMWWNSLQHQDSAVPPADRLRSFNPIYRFSAAAAKFLTTSHIEGWTGHHEVLLPTLLYGRFRIRDFGGVGEFVKPGDEESSYVGSPWSDTDQRIRTMRLVSHGCVFYLPRNQLIHPVKPGRVARKVKGLFQKIAKRLYQTQSRH
jgi:hypothetical protein